MPRNPPKANQFKPGVSGNPLGGKLHDPRVRKLRALTNDELCEVGSLILKGSLDDLQALVKNGKATALQAMIASIAIRAINKGETQALDAILNRLVGLPKKQIEHSGAIDGVAPQVSTVIFNIPSNGRDKPRGSR